MAKKDLIKRADGSYSPRGLWDNIRAAKGSGKEPTKEMLAQEKKIKREMAKGGSLSHFYPSNIQAYPQGGSIGGPPDKVIRGANFYVNPYYTNVDTGSLMPTSNFGLSKSWGPKQAKHTFSADIGIPYSGNNQVGDFGQNEVDTTGTGQNNIVGGWNPRIGAFDAENPFSAGIHYGYEGINKNTAGGRGSLNLDADYNTKTGLGAAFTGGLKFDAGRVPNKYNEIRPGSAYGTIYPNITLGFGHGTNTGFSLGTDITGEWKPNFLRNTPLSLFGKAQFQAGLGGGRRDDVAEGYEEWSNQHDTYGGPVQQNNLTFRPSYSLQAGIKMPVREVQQSLQGINIANLNLPSINKDSKNPEEEESFYTDNSASGFGRGTFNASPIDKRWNKGAADIYVPSTQAGPNPESIIYNPNDPEGTNSFADGGPIEDLLEKFYKKNQTANIYASPFYTNALVGNFKPGYIAGIETDSGLGRKAPGFYAGAYAGQQYNPSVPFNTLLSPEQQAYQNSITNITVSEPGETGPLNTAALTGGAPNAQNILVGGKIGWQGKVVKGGGAGGNNPIFPNAMPRLEAGLEYAPSTGLGGHWEVGSVFPFGNNYRNGLVKAGRPSGIIEPYTGMTLNSTKGSKLGWGVRAEAEYRPRAFKDFPMSFYGKAALTGGFGAESKKAGTISNVVGQDPNYDPGQNNNISTNTTGAGPQDKTLGTMFRPHVSGEIGVRLPLQQIEAPNINMPDINLSPLTSFLGRANKGGEENLQIQGGDPMGGDFGPRYNASPIDKRWNPNAQDIYIPSTKTDPNAESIIYDPNDPEGLNQQNNYSKGGAMNFKSPAAYKAWLAYGHASGEFAKTPGNQAVSIKGQPHKVQHAFGGNMYSMGGRAFADGGQLTQFTEGGSHEMNPLGGIPQGFAPDGKLNLVEQGETKLNAADYVFSDQIKVSKEIASLYGLSKGDVGKTFADVSKKANRPNSRRENDTIEQVAIQRDLENLMQAQEQQKEMEKQEAIAEMEAKYPGVQVVDQAAMQQADAEMQAGMQQPMMDEAAMMQQQQQMAPPAQAPQEIDPAMMAQMQQQGMMRMGGKMFNMGGHMYGNGGTFLRGVGAGAYGVAEGMLDTLTFGLTDNLTDKGYQALSGLGKPLDSKQAARLDATRGFGNAAGAVGAAALTGGATTKSAISEGVEGLAQGVSSLPGTNEKVDKVAQGVGQAASIFGSVAGGAPKNMNAIPLGVMEGNKAVTQLMNLPQNPFITQAVNTTGRMFASGGFLGAPTNNMFVNQLDPGGPLGESTVTFNINGKPVTMSYEQAINDPTILDMFMPAEADVDADGKYGPEDIDLAKQALRDHFDIMGTLQPAGMAVQDNVAADVIPAAGMTAEEYIATLEKPEGMSESEFKKMKTALTKKETLGDMKASPLLATASALPALYNIGRGLFGKVDQLDVKDYLNNARISPYEMNIDPQLAAAQRAYSTAMQATRNAAPGAGSYLATLGNLATQKQQAIKDLYAQKENFDKSQKLEADKYNAQVEKENLQTDLTIQQYNNQARAAKQNLLAAGLTQLADAAQGLSTTDLQEKYLQTIAPEFAGSFQYLSIPEQLAALAAARAGRKGKGTKAENV